MRFLKEALGESVSLDAFVKQAEDKFSKYYVIELFKEGEKPQHIYVAYQSEADKIFESAKEDARKSGLKVKYYRVKVKTEIEDIDEFDSSSDDGSIAEEV